MLLSNTQSTDQISKESAVDIHGPYLMKSNDHLTSSQEPPSEEMYYYLTIFSPGSIITVFAYVRIDAGNIHPL